MSKKITRHVLFDVLKRFSEGASLSSLALELGVTQSGLSRGIARHGLKIPKKEAISESVANEIFRLYSSGLSQQKIADQLKIPRTTIASSLRRRGFVFRAHDDVVQLRSKIKDVEVQSLHLRHRQGETVASLAREVSLSKAALLSRMKNLGLEVRSHNRMTLSLAREIQQLLLTGANIAEVAQRYEFSESGLRQALQRHGLVPKLSRAEYAAARKDRTKKRPEARERGVSIARIREAHRRHTELGLSGIALAAELGLNPSSLYERFRRASLPLRPDVRSSAPKRREVVSDSKIREIYAVARQERKTIIQVIREIGLGAHAGPIGVRARKMGLTAPSASEVYGNRVRHVCLYILTVEVPGMPTGIYAGQSVDTRKRLRDHLNAKPGSASARSEKGQYMQKARAAAAELGASLEQFARIDIVSVHAGVGLAAEAERQLIRRVQNECHSSGKIFLNSLQGAPAGGYGRVMTPDAEKAAIQLFAAGKTSQQVADELGFGRSTINRLLQRQGAARSRAESRRLSKAGGR
jgi:DNA-binding CsgD family transcriptional regulator